MSILVDLCHTLNASKMVIIIFTYNNIHLNIFMISSTVLNSGNVQCEWKPSVAQPHSKMAIDGRLLSAICR